MKKILVINLGSTSTKLAIYEDSELKKEISIEHGEEELRKYNTVIDQKDFRKEAILNWLASEGESLNTFVQENDMRKIEARINEGDQEAELARNALAYQIAKTIGAYSVVSREKVDAIVLTGGLAHSKAFTELVGSYVKNIAPILVFPGESEGTALQLGALRALNGEEDALTYTKVS